MRKAKQDVIKHDAGKISLVPLPFGEAVRGLLQTAPVSDDALVKKPKKAGVEKRAAKKPPKKN